jgi:hypothetical protein
VALTFMRCFPVCKYTNPFFHFSVCTPPCRSGTPDRKLTIFVVFVSSLDTSTRPFTADFLSSACKRDRKVCCTDFQLDLTEELNDANFYTTNIVCVWHAGLPRRFSYTSR